MARGFALCSFGVLCLTTSVLLGAEVILDSPTRAAASVVVPGSGIVAMWRSQNPVMWWSMALDENGQVWNIKGVPGPAGWDCWERNAEYDPPVPVSQIKFWAPDRLITVDNVFWSYDAGGPYGSKIWHNCGPWPGGPVPTSPSTWGGVKGKYEGKN